MIVAVYVPSERYTHTSTLLINLLIVQACCPQNLDYYFSQPREVKTYMLTFEAACGSHVVGVMRVSVH